MGDYSVKTRQHKRIFYVDSISEKKVLHLTLTLPPVSKFECERPWDTYMNQEGRKTVFLNIGATVQLAMLKYKASPSMHDRIDLGSFVRENFNMLLHRMDMYNPPFYVVDCFVSRTKCVRRINCEKLLSREVLVDLTALFKDSDGDRKIYIEMLLKLPRRWQEVFHHYHLMTKWIRGPAFINRTVHW